MPEWLLTSHLILVVSFVAGLLTLFHLLRQRRSPQSALAWIGFAIVMPYVAVPLFLLLGWRKLERPPVIQSPVAGAPMEALLSSFGAPARRPGNRFELCTTGEQARGALIELIEGATKSIQVEIFILHLDVVGRDLLRRLKRKAAEGVSVQILLDGLGSFMTRPLALRPLRRSGVEVKFFHPLLAPRWWLRTNLRNHRKLVIADGRIVLSGGINLADEYLGVGKRNRQWTDLAFRAEGPIVADYQNLFAEDWSYAGRESRAVAFVPSSAPGDAELQLVPSGPDVAGDSLHSALLQAIYRARRRVWVATPYFLPSSEIVKALAVAARSGIDVTIVVPRTSDHRLADWARGPYLRELKGHGCKVEFFQAGMLHAKAVLIDDGLAMLGSANLDLRSLYLNFEVMLLIHDEKHVRIAEAWMRSLSPWTTELEPSVGRIRETFEGAVRLLSPLL
ncbi:MAG: cardiolipin synthase [Myxococcales bacterium]|nr:cardiolipin synthase [Myxococcales bacterium]